MGDDDKSRGVVDGVVVPQPRYKKGDVVYHHYVTKDGVSCTDATPKHERIPQEVRLNKPTEFDAKCDDKSIFKKFRPETLNLKTIEDVSLAIKQCATRYHRLRKLLKEIKTPPPPAPTAVTARAPRQTRHGRAPSPPPPPSTTQVSTDSATKSAGGMGSGSTTASTLPEAASGCPFCTLAGGKCNLCKDNYRRRLSPGEEVLRRHRLASSYR